MECNIINTIGDCNRMSLAGVKFIQLIPFGDIYDYTYTDDNLSMITGYKLSSIPVQLYTSPSSVLTGELQSNTAVYYNHTLSTIVPIIEQEKRTEFEHIMKMPLSIIVTDKNDKCWLIGQDKPVKVTSYSVSTGDKNGDNIYTIRFEGISKYQLRQVNCFDGECYSSFDVFELRESIFGIENASTVTFTAGTVLQVVADSTLLTYTLTADMIPTDWDTSGSQRLADSIQLNNLISSTNGQVSMLAYNSMTDTAVIVFNSPDTTYDNLIIGSESPIESIVKIDLNIKFTLVDPLNNMDTMITVTDDTMSVLYSGYPEEFIGTDYDTVYGFVNDAHVNASALYPNGTTLTLTVENLNCPTKTFVYEVESYNCDLEGLVSYNYGHNYSIDIPKNESFNMAYQKVVLFYDEWQFNIISSVLEATNDFSVFEAAVLDKLTNDPACPIIPSSITVTDNTTYVTIEFESSRRGSKLHALYAYHDNMLSFSETSASYGLHTNLMNLNTSVSSDAYISIVEDTSTNELAGQYGDAPDVNTGYSIEDFDDVANPTTIESIAWNINDKLEIESYTLNASTTTCPVMTSPVDTAVCFDDAPLSITRRYDRFEADASTMFSTELDNAYLFQYTIGGNPHNYVVNTLNNAVNNLNLDELSSCVLSTFPLHLGENPVKVLNFYFDPYNYKYVLELDCHQDVVWVNIEGNDLSDSAVAFNNVESFDITDCEFDPIINPHTVVDWLFNDVDAVGVSEHKEAMEDFYRFRGGVANPTYFNYKSGPNEIEVGVDGITNYDGFDFTLYDATFTILQIISLPAATASVQVPVTATIGDVAYVSVSSLHGAFDFLAWSTAMGVNIDFYIPYNTMNRNLWGTMCHWSCLTPAIFVPTPTIFSALCP